MLEKSVQTFRDLKVWQKAHELVLGVYKVTKNFPPDEKFGLVAQIRRATTSIATNIVEGHKRNSRKDFLHFLNIAQGSLEEAKYLLLLSRDLNLITTDTYPKLFAQCDEVGRMLYGFQRNLRS